MSKYSLLIAGILLLALTLRLAGNDWGLVTAGNLESIGYPLTTDYTNEMVIDGFVYDEGNFKGFLKFFPNSKKIIDEFFQGKISFTSTVKKLYLELRSDRYMEMTPVAPMLFGTWAVGWAQLGNILGWNHMDKASIKSIFYHSNRTLSAILASFTILVLIFLIKKTTSPSPVLLFTIFGSLLFCFQSVNIVHSHWVSYNPLTALIELANTALFLYFISQFDKLTRRKHILFALLLGACTGIAIAIKYTGGITAPVTVLMLAVMAWRQFDNRNILKKYWTSLYLFSTVLIISATFAAYYLIISPSFFIDNPSVVSLGSDLKTEGNRFNNLIHYFLKTLPAGLGWPVYLSGLLGIASGFVDKKNYSRERLCLLITAAIYIAAFSLNQMGKMPQRSLTVYALWIVFAIWFFSYIQPRIKPLIFKLILVFVLSGCIFSSLQVDYNLVKDTLGYRTEASRYVINNIPRGSNLILHKKSKHGHIDLTLFETYEKPASPLYHYQFLYADHLAMQGNIKGYAIYPENWNNQKPLATFHSIVKKESRLIRSTRMLLGFHRNDQLIDVPSFSIYRINGN